MLGIKTLDVKLLNIKNLDTHAGAILGRPMPRSPSSSATPQLGSLPGYVGFHLRRVHNASLKSLDQALAKMQLTTAMYGVLEVLNCNPEVPQGQLARIIGLTSPSMVPLIDKLTERGLTQRIRHDHDRRTVCIRITAEGRKLWTRVARIVREHETALQARLSPDESAQLLALLAKLGTHAPPRPDLP